MLDVLLIALFLLFFFQMVMTAIFDDFALLTIIGVVYVLTWAAVLALLSWIPYVALPLFFLLALIEGVLLLVRFLSLVMGVTG